MASSRIVVVGSLMLDVVVRMPRLPLIGESLLGHDVAMFVGGKGGNQALAAKRLGADRVTMIGRVGTDEFGDRIVQTLTDGGIDCQFVQRDPVASTGVAIPFVFDDGRNSIISLPQANLAMTTDDIDAARDAITGADMLLVQSEVSMNATHAAMRIAKAASLPVIFNAAPVALLPRGILAAADYLVVNEVEADALCPEGAGDRMAQARVLQSLVPTVLVTLGEDGAVIAYGTTIEAIQAFSVCALDSVGAGDAFCGALAVGLCEGMPLASAVRLASAAGAISVTRPGAAASLPTRDEVVQLMDAPV